MDPPRSSRKKKSKKEKKSKSGVRTKFLIESLRQDYYNLRDENDRLREIVEKRFPKREAEAILADCFDLNQGMAVGGGSIDELAAKMTGMNTGDDDEDY